MKLQNVLPDVSLTGYTNDAHERKADHIVGRERSGYLNKFSSTTDCHVPTLQPFRPYWTIHTFDGISGQTASLQDKIKFQEYQ